ncbi:MAG: hypothetical protein L0H79_09175 [Intrasporangium sp.]|nr:hypothetical protein [Intrasporangium sp.]
MLTEAEFEVKKAQLLR